MFTDMQTTLTMPRVREARLPERLSPRWAATLAGGDAAIVLFISLVVFGGASNTAVAAFVSTALICCAFWVCGLYARSFAVVARDEGYYACTALLTAAIPVFLIDGGVGQVSALPLLIVLLFSAVATSAWHAGMFIQRRSNVEVSATRNSVTPTAWHARESSAYLLTKRCFDIVIGVLALVVSLPIMLAAAMAIVVESGGPVLFRQERVGRDGTRFEVYKFRTMINGAGKEWVKPGDARITRIGAFLRRTSIDELPQLLNVLAGDMSIVGPRPEMTEFAARFAQDLPSYEQRHIVTPGMTGWAQVYHKRNLEPDEVRDILHYDLFYVERACVVIDMAIVLKTIAEVLFHRAV
jgi:lipopolysaccharide/colanic/teichoic acid biosynthesis glycosyltransferase